MAEIFRSIGLQADGRQRTLAVKRILPQFSDDEEFVSLLVDEAQVMVRLNHPNIIPIVEFGKAEGSYYIAMEYVDGTTLKDLFRRVKEKKDQFSVDLAVHIVREIGSGLAYAHRKTDDGGKPLELVHRDISPANILISFEGEVKIADFGISKAANQSHSTRIGVIRGKTGYMSPEQTKGGAVIDHRSDIYSLGIILFELLSGERLYKAGSVPEALRMIREGKIPPMASLRPGIPTELEKIALKALSQQPEDRYQRTEDFVDSLNEFLTRDFGGGRPVRVTHTHLVGFLRRYYASEIAAKSGEATAVNLQLGWVDAAGSTVANVTELPVQAPQTIAANPLYELSEPERSVPTASSPSAGGTPTRGPAADTRTVSLQDAVSASIKIARNFSPFLIWGTAVGLGAILVTAIAFRVIRKPQAPIAAKATPTPRIEQRTPLPSPSPKPTGERVNKATIHLFAAPESAPAKVYLDGQLKGNSPIDLRNLEVGRKYALRVEAKGFFPREMVLEVSEPGDATKTVFLNPVQGESVRPPPPPVGPPAKLGSKKPIPRPALLSVQTTPWSEIFVDGKKVGTTPLIKIVVSAGRHRVRFQNPMLKLGSYEISVEFPAGREVRCIVNLNDRKGSCK
jgi:serine/threonine-protein kinase